MQQTQTQRERGGLSDVAEEWGGGDADGDAAVDAAVAAVLAKAGPRGHILNLGHGVLVGTPEGAVARMFDVSKNARAAV